MYLFFPVFFLPFKQYFTSMLQNKVSLLQSKKNGGQDEIPQNLAGAKTDTRTESRPKGSWIQIMLKSNHKVEHEERFCFVCR